MHPGAKWFTNRGASVSGRLPEVTAGCEVASTPPATRDAPAIRDMTGRRRVRLMGEATFSSGAEEGNVTRVSPSHQRPSRKVEKLRAEQLQRPLPADAALGVAVRGGSRDRVDHDLVDPVGRGELPYLGRGPLGRTDH